MRKHRKWTKQEIDYLKENYGKSLVIEICKKIKKSKGAIIQMAKKLKFKSNLPHSLETIKKMKEKKTKKLLIGYNLPSNELAYIIGVLNGDGSLGLRRFSLTTIDYDFLINVKKILEK